MTIKDVSICHLIQSFPVLLILAQKHSKCLETPFIYKPPSPTQPPEYYHALDALFQNLYGHGYPGTSHEVHQPCYTYSKKYGTKPCAHAHPHYGTSYGSYPSYTSYPSYQPHPSYSSYGHGYRAPAHSPVMPSYNKGNIYSNITYGNGYASTQGYTSNRYKVVVKKTRIGKTKRRSQKLQDSCAPKVLSYLSCSQRLDEM